MEGKVRRQGCGRGQTSENAKKNVKKEKRKKRKRKNKEKKTLKEEKMLAVFLLLCLQARNCSRSNQTIGCAHTWM